MSGRKTGSALATWGLIVLLAAGSGCGPAVFGGAVTSAYMVETDGRAAGRMLDDSTITAKINFDLINDGAVKVMDIDVDTQDGVVMLSGVVATEWEMERAIEVASRVAGVKEVKNNLQIGSRSFKQAVSDKMLGGNIKTSLVKERNLKSLNIDVDVYNGVVTLTGVVVAQEEKDRAIEIARTTHGTVRVVDNIIVKERKKQE